jgi:hypothetical protein
MYCYENSVHPVTIDLENNPHLYFRIDSFSFPRRPERSSQQPCTATWPSFARSQAFVDM